MYPLTLSMPPPLSCHWQHLLQAKAGQSCMQLPLNLPRPTWRSLALPLLSSPAIFSHQPRSRSVWTLCLLHRALSSLLSWCWTHQRPLHQLLLVPLIHLRAHPLLVHQPSASASASQWQDTHQRSTSKTLTASRTSESGWISISPSSKVSAIMRVGLSLSRHGMPLNVRTYNKMTPEYVSCALSRCNHNCVLIPSRYLQRLPNKKPQSKVRPPVIHRWIQAGRIKTFVGTAANPKAFGEAWWLWWIALQAPSRSVKEGRPIRESDVDLSKIVIRHRNGIITILMTLAWWRQGMGNHPDSSSIHADWLEAVDELQWVLDNR